MEVVALALQLWRARAMFVFFSTLLIKGHALSTHRILPLAILKLPQF